ncbi:MAG: hypothetical protein JWN65_1913 [Solirubrobacterales bacterium]|nr:hypothetical protein [Solirubrobacterales bacterium]
MNRPRVLAVLALVTGLLLVVLVAGCPSGGETGPKGRTELTIRDPLGEALRYIPSSAAVVAVVQTDAGAGPLRSALDLAQAFPGAGAITGRLEQLVNDRAGLSLASEVTALAGAPAVVARMGVSPKAASMGAWVVLDEVSLSDILRSKVDSGTVSAGDPYKKWTIYTRPGAVYAQRDRVLLTASDLVTLRAAIDRRLKTGRGAGLTRATFNGRSLSGIPARRALIRVAVTGPGLRNAIARQAPDAAQLPWVAALRGAGLAVAADPDGLHVSARLRTDEATLTDADLPIAAGAQAPEATGDAPIVVGVRNVDQTAGFLVRTAQLVAPERLKTYTTVRDLLRRFAQVDVEADILGTLTKRATLTVPATGGVTLAAQTSDEGRLRDALARLARIGRLAGIAGSFGIGLDMNGIAIRDEGDDRYTVLKDDEPVAVIAVRNGIFVASSDPLTDVDAVVDALDATGEPTGPSSGAVIATLAPTVLADLLVDRFGLPDIGRVALDPLGDATATARAELGYLLVGLDVQVKG